MKVFLCIDAGTTKIKTALTTENSKIIDIEHTDVEAVMLSNGVCEMDMAQFWDSVCRCIHILQGRNKSIWNSICGVGVCAQGDGAWLIDRDGNPVRRAVLWNDTRKGTILESEIRKFNEQLVALNATPLFSGSFPVILNYLKRNEPENFSRIRWILHCKDWINYKLTGSIATDRTDASTAITDIFSNEYKLEILDLLDIGEIKECLPRVFESYEVMGYISDEIEKTLNIPEKVPVIAGAIDILAAATGNNLLTPGQKGSIFGTTLGNFVVLNEEQAKNQKVCVGSILCHTQPKSYIRQMSALSGASALDWVRSVLAPDESFHEIETEIKKIPIGSEGVLFLPYLYGERAPFRSPDASGSFLGLRAYQNKYYMIRASYEGIIMSLYDCYQNLPEGEKRLFLSGGAADSDLICQMVSDAMGQEVVRNDVKELGIMGVSYLLAQSTNKNSETVQEQSLTYFYPEGFNHKKYVNLYDKYLHYKKKIILDNTYV